MPNPKKVNSLWFIVNRKTTSHKPSTINWRQRRHGFTLIELLVVISIIGILAGLGTISYSKTRASARDAQRKNDYKQIKTALFAYQQDYKTFPPATVSSLETTWFDALEPYFPSSVAPKDPKNSASPFYYHYITYDNGLTFELHFSLENLNDTNFPPECSNFPPSVHNWTQNGIAVTRLVCRS